MTALQTLDPTSDDAADLRRAASVRKKIGLVFFGQSNERGNSELVNASAVNQMTAFPQAFRSLINPTITASFPGVHSMTQLTADERWYPQGSPLCKVYDDLWAGQYEALIANCSIGSLSFFNDIVAYPRNRRAPQEDGANYFRQRRAAGIFGPTDLGCSGTMTVQNGHVFEATTGSTFVGVLRNEGPPIYVSGGDRLPDRLDYLLSPTSSKSLAGTGAPDWASATTVGSTVTDGAVVWTNIGTAAALGYVINTAFRPRSVDGPGFDPLGLLRRAVRYAQDMRAQGCERIIVYLCNGQSDAGSTSQANYQVSLTYITEYLRGLGYEVMIGLSTYTRASATAGWDALVAARTATLAAFASDAGVHAGADLYTLMGNVEGANGLTYNTTGSTADNNAHINAQAQIVAGGHHSAALLAGLA